MGNAVAEKNIIWLAIDVTAIPEAAESVESAFNALDSLGTEINHLRKASTETVLVTGYFKELPEELIFQDELHYALRVHGLADESIITTERREVENADWLHEWKKHWQPTVIGQFVIAPPWETVDEPDKIVIKIEPNMAFGTGTHETTRLCVSAIERLFFPGDSFLDVGTGTGILAIAAAKKIAAEGKKRAEFNQDISEPVFEKSDPEKFLQSFSSQPSAAKILACDTDTDSIKIARENALLNGVGDVIEFYEGSISADTVRFDFVCANLTIDVILPILPVLLKTKRKTLVLSGILAEQEAMIVDALNHNSTQNHAIERLGEWIAVIVPTQKQY